MAECISSYTSYNNDVEYVHIGDVEKSVVDTVALLNIVLFKVKIYTRSVFLNHLYIGLKCKTTFSTMASIICKRVFIHFA